MYKNIHVIINPASGQAKPILRPLNDVFNEYKTAWHTSVTTPEINATELTQNAIKNDADLIVACGGDGTVKEVINGLAEHDIPLAILHGGTGNAVAYNLGIPADIAEATALIFEDHTLKSVDLGKATCENDPDNVGYFILRMSVGLQPKILESATRELKSQFGNLAYIIAGLRELSNPESLSFEILIDGEQVTGEGLMCIVANSATIGGNNSFDFAPNVDVGDGLLDVFVFDTKFESLVSMVNSSLAQNETGYPYRWKGKEIQVKMKQAGDATLDGEPFAQTPINICVIPEAVKVIVPKIEG